MGSNTAFEAADLAGRGVLQDETSPFDPSPQGESLRLTRRTALSIILVLSLGLWAALWAAVASLASAALG